MARKRRGRQRVEMVKMQNKKNLGVTFSKRRTGLFKKANELSILCGVDVAIVSFSPGKKAFSFGHPSVEAVVERFLGHDDYHQQSVNENGGAPAMKQLIEAHQNDMVHKLSMELTDLEGKIEVEKKRSDEIDKVVEANCGTQGWMRGPYDEFKMEQLLDLKNSMKRLSNCIHEKVEQLNVMNGNGFPFGPL